MVRVSFQRAAIAILLMGMMIEPLGICLQQSLRGAHSCCMQAEPSHCMQTNCCVVKTQLPATLAALTLPGSSPSEVSHEYLANLDATTTNTHQAVAVIPPNSPPTGSFILRI